VITDHLVALVYFDRATVICCLIPKDTTKTINIII